MLRWGDKDSPWRIYQWLVMTFSDQVTFLILKFVENPLAAMEKHPIFIDMPCTWMTSWGVVPGSRKKLPDGTYTDILAKILAKV